MLVQIIKKRVKKIEALRRNREAVNKQRIKQRAQKAAAGEEPKRGRPERRYEAVVGGSVPKMCHVKRHSFMRC